MQSSSNVFVFTDKTRNICEMIPDDYNKVLTENITANYKQGKDETADEINTELKDVSDKLVVADRIEPMSQRNAFITLKSPEVSTY